MLTALSVFPRQSFVQNAAAAEDTLDYESDDDVQMQLTLLQQAYDETRQEYKKGHKLFSASLKALARVVHPLERFIKNNETRLLSIFTRMDAVLSSCNNGEYRLEDLQTVQEAMKNDIDEMDNHLCFMIMFKASITEYTLASCFVDNRSTQAYDSSASDVTNTTLKVPTMKEQDPSTPASELEKIKLDTHAELVAVHSTLDSLDKRHKELQHLIYERWNSTKHTLKDFSTDLIIASMSPLCCQPALLEDSMRNGLPPGQIDLAIGTLSQGIADMQEEAIAAEELSKKLTAFELEKELVNATRHFE